jgi:hypothetical protein
MDDKMYILYKRESTEEIRKIQTEKTGLNISAFHIKYIDEIFLKMISGKTCI